MGSIHGLLSNPLGHGVGVGGNISDASANATQGGLDIQNFGNDFAYESGLGVLAYQAGVAGLITVFSFWRALGRQIHAFAGRNESELNRAVLYILPTALIVLLANSLFQEEVFTPTSWGFWMLLSGAFLARALGGHEKIDEAETPEMSVRPI
jgi:hypothetical protein